MHLSIGIATARPAGRRRRADPQRRPGDVPGQGVRQGPVRGSSTVDARRGAEAPHAPRGGAAAVSREELVVDYQPIVSLADGEVAAEALVRWNHPERGLLPPASSIALAEETGAVVGDRRHRARASGCEAGREGTDPRSTSTCARRAGRPRLASTGSTPWWTSSQLAARAARARDHGGAFVGDDPVPIAVLEALHERGMGVAVDDFGTGYSSLATCARCRWTSSRSPSRSSTRPHGLTRAPRAGPCDDRPRAALDLHVVAEGIERPDQIAALRASDASTARASSTACRPMPIWRFGAWTCCATRLARH